MSPQGRFENTLTGMMEALAEIKGKGDLMMGAIRGQRELLFDVRGEVREAEERLAMVERRRNEEEKLMREATSRRIMAEAKVKVSKNKNLPNLPNLARRALINRRPSKTITSHVMLVFLHSFLFYLFLFKTCHPLDEDDPAGKGGV